MYHGERIGEGDFEGYGHYTQVRALRDGGCGWVGEGPRADARGVSR